VTSAVPGGGGEGKEVNERSGGPAPEQMRRRPFRLLRVDGDEGNKKKENKENKARRATVSGKQGEMRRWERSDLP